MFSIECVDDIVLLWVNLVFKAQIFFDKVDEFLHALSEQPIDVQGELFAQDVDPLETRSSISLALALRTVVH